jgi:hypothetical protein
MTARSQGRGTHQGFLSESCRKKEVFHVFEFLWRSRSAGGSVRLVDKLREIQRERSLKHRGSDRVTSGSLLARKYSKEEKKRDVEKGKNEKNDRMSNNS